MKYDELCAHFIERKFQIHGRAKGRSGECHLVVSKRGNWDYGDKECRNFIGVKLDNSDAEYVCFGFSVSGSALASRRVTNIIGDPEEFLLKAGLQRFRCFLQEDDTPGRKEDFMLHSRSPETDFVMDDPENLRVEVNRIKKEILELLWENKYNGSGSVLNFFQKKWPQQEFNALFVKMGTNERSILPIWHGLSAQDVQKYSPMVADLYAVDSSEGIDKVVAQIVKVCRAKRN